MALSAAQKNKILQILGYPGKSLDSGTVLYDKVLVDRLDSLSAATESLVKSLLDKISAIETKMDKATCRMSTKELGDIVLNSDNEMKLLRKERKTISKEISYLLDVPMKYSSNMVSVQV